MLMFLQLGTLDLYKPSDYAKITKVAYFTNALVIICSVRIVLKLVIDN